MVRAVQSGTAYIEPGWLWQNPFVESFRFRVRDELLDVEKFSCLDRSARDDRRLARRTTTDPNLVTETAGPTPEGQDGMWTLRVLLGL
jgi:hypothetical protein